MQRKEAEALELKKKYSIPTDLEELQKVEAFMYMIQRARRHLLIRHLLKIF